MASLNVSCSVIPELVPGQTEILTAEPHPLSAHTHWVVGVSMSLLLKFRISSHHKQNHYDWLAQGKMCLTDHGSLFCHENCTLSHSKILVKVIKQKDELPIFISFFSTGNMELVAFSAMAEG